MSLNEQLLPCPFCGGKEVMQHLDYSMLCAACGAEGALHETSAEAIAAWNRRSPASPAVQPPADKAAGERVYALLAKNAIYMGDAFINELLAVAASTVPAAPAELSDAQIVEVLASLGIDSEKSKYGFDVLQVHTTVPGIRDIVAAYCTRAGQPPAQPALQADAGADAKDAALSDEDAALSRRIDARLKRNH